MLKDNEENWEKLGPQCHSVPGWQRQTLKETATRWHRTAWSHLNCRETIVALVLHSADNAVSFVASGIAESSDTPAFTDILECYHR